MMRLFIILLFIFLLPNSVIADTATIKLRATVVTMVSVNYELNNMVATGDGNFAVVPILTTFCTGNINGECDVSKDNENISVTLRGE